MGLYSAARGCSWSSSSELGYRSICHFNAAPGLATGHTEANCCLVPAWIQRRRSSHPAELESAIVAVHLSALGTLESHAAILQLAGLICCLYPVELRYRQPKHKDDTAMSTEEIQIATQALSLVDAEAVTLDMDTLQEARATASMPDPHILAMIGSSMEQDCQMRLCKL
ncbi:unnamed protein product [Sympodiomycopsis kandeliae]